MSKVNMDLSHMPVNVIAISNTHQTYGVAVNTAFMVKNQTYLVQRNIKNNAGLSYILVIQNGAVVYATPVDDFSINNLNNRTLVEGIVDKFVPCDNKLNDSASKKLPDSFNPSAIHGLPYDFAFASGAAKCVLDLINQANPVITIDLSKGELNTQDCKVGGGNITLSDLSNTGFESVGFPKTIDCGNRLYMVGNLAHKLIGKEEAINIMYKQMYLAGSSASLIPAKAKNGLSIAAAKVNSIIRDDAKVYGGLVIGNQLIIARVLNKSDITPRAFVVLATASNSLIFPVNEFEISEETPDWDFICSTVKSIITESMYTHERINAEVIYNLICNNNGYEVANMSLYLEQFNGDNQNLGFDSFADAKAIVESSHKATDEPLLKAAGINKGDEAVALDIAHSRTTPPLVMGICDSTPKILMRKDDDTGANSIYLDIEGDQRWIADVAGYDTDVIDEVNKLLNSGQPKSPDMGPVTEYYCAPIEEIYGTCRVMDEGEFGITTPSYWSIYSRHQSGISQWVADYADAGLCKSQTDLLNAKLTIK